MPWLPGQTSVKSHEKRTLSAAECDVKTHLLCSANLTTTDPGASGALDRQPCISSRNFLIWVGFFFFLMYQFYSSRLLNTADKLTFCL